MAANYKSLAEEAVDLEAIVAERFPGLSDEDRGQFCAAVLYKVADLYRFGGESVQLVSYDADGRMQGRRALLILKKED